MQVTGQSLSTGGSDFQLVRVCWWMCQSQADDAPAAGEIQGIAGPEHW